VRQAFACLNAVRAAGCPGDERQHYELATIAQKFSAAEAVVRCVHRRTPAREKYSKIVGLWLTSSVNPRSLPHLAYPDLNARAAARAAAMQDPACRNSSSRSPGCSGNALDHHAAGIAFAVEVGRRADSGVWDGSRSNHRLHPEVRALRCTWHRWRASKDGPRAPTVILRGSQGSHLRMRSCLGLTALQIIIRAFAERDAAQQRHRHQARNGRITVVTVR